MCKWSEQMRLEVIGMKEFRRYVRLTHAEALADVIRVERVMKLEGRVSDEVIGLISHQLRHP